MPADRILIVIPTFDEADNLPRIVPEVLAQDARIHVLVVDDNATNRMILDEMLSNWQMNVTSVAGVDAALEQLRAARASDAPFELVLSDVNMPGRDGFDLAAELQVDEQLADAVILMLTSAKRPGEVQRSRDLGVSSYLHKPVKQSELYDAIVAALGVNGVEESADSSGHLQSNVQLPKLRILLVEDSVVNQRLALALLNRWGHDVTVANNGLEALELVDQREFQLVLMDVQMPEMDGLEATRRIRESEQTSGEHLPIIAMTAHAMKGDRERCLESGMDDYVSKPVRAWQLLEAMAGQIAAEPGQVCVPRDPPESSGDATESEPPMAATIPYTVDWPVSIRIVQGDLDLLRDVIDAFKDESRIVLDGLRKALSEEDQKTAQRMAHTIKASFRTFGIDDAYDLAYECEVASREGRLDEVQSRLPELEEATRIVEGQFQSFVDTGRIPG